MPREHQVQEGHYGQNYEDTKAFIEERHPELAIYFDDALRHLRTSGGIHMEGGFIREIRRTTIFDVEKGVSTRVDQIGVFPPHGGLIGTVLDQIHTVEADIMGKMERLSGKKGLSAEERDFYHRYESRYREYINEIGP